MSPFTLDQLRDGLRAADEHAGRGAEWDDHEAERGARARRWLGLGGDRERFAQIAERLGGYVERDGVPTQWARVGGLWHLAGDTDRAAWWCRRLTRERRQHVESWTRAGALYLLGDYRTARKADRADPAGWLSDVEIARDLPRLREERETLVLAAQLDDGRPDNLVPGRPLTRWDWVEESFLLESRLLGAPVPSHLEMLQRCGALREGPAPAVPLPCSPEVGLYRSDLHGGWLRVTEEDEVVVRVNAKVFVVLLREFGLWGAQITDHPEEPGEWATEPVYPDWRHAATATARWVHANRRPDNEAARQAATITELVIAAGGDAGEPVPAP